RVHRAGAERALVFGQRRARLRALHVFSGRGIERVRNEPEQALERRREAVRSLAVVVAVEERNDHVQRLGVTDRAPRWIDGRLDTGGAVRSLELRRVEV